MISERTEVREEKRLLEEQKKKRAVNEACEEWMENQIKDPRESEWWFPSISTSV